MTCYYILLHLGTRFEYSLILVLEAESVSVPCKANSKFMQAVDVIKRVMNDGNYGICNGSVHKKVPESMYTYVHCASVEDYLMSLLGNVEVADVLIPHIGQLTNFLSKPSCALIKPIKIDLNFIEVLPEGTCFDIEKKVFVVQPENLNGSPRAFVKYMYDEEKVPNPVKFIEGM